MNLFVSSSKTAKPQVLLVDDNPDNLILLQCILEETGYQISTASCGLEALSMVQTQPPDLIFLDLMMPDMSGIEVASLLRGNPATHNIPIVLVIPYMHDLEDEDCRLVNGMLAKPIDEHKLFSLLDLLINLRQTEV